MSCLGVLGYVLFLDLLFFYYCVIFYFFLVTDFGSLIFGSFVYYINELPMYWYQLLMVQGLLYDFNYFSFVLL